VIRAILAATTFIGLALAGPALAQTQDEASACAAIVADPARLACYDALFRPADASTSVVVQSSQAIPAFPDGRATATFALRCEAGRPIASFSCAGHLLSATGSNVSVSLRRDLQTGQSLSLPVSADRLSALIVGEADGSQFVQSLRGVSDLGVRLTPAAFRSLAVQFRVASLEQQMAAVVAGCS